MVMEESNTGTKALHEDLEADTDVDAMEKWYSLSCSSWLVQPVFLQNPRLPAQGCHHPQWAGPSPINS